MNKIVFELQTRPYLFAACLSALLLLANVAVEPNFIRPDNIPENLATLAPLAIIAMASTPSIVAGGGGIDISVSAIMIFSSVILVDVLLDAGINTAWVAIPILMLMGAAIGAINGLLVTFGRFQAVIATLCMLFIVGGLASKVSTDSDPGSNWTQAFGDQVWIIPGGLILIGIPAIIWFALGRTPFHRVLYGVGSNDATAFSAGVNVSAMRIAAYALNGSFAAVAGIALTAVVQSSSAGNPAQYALLALAAVALGGVQFQGGRGGLVCAFFGATALYLVQTLLSAASVPSSWLQLVYGLMLVIGVVIGAAAISPRWRSAA